MKNPKRPLLRICLSLTTLALTSYTIAFVIPYWFARYPQSKNRFIRLGLWEICVESFMPESVGNLMYSGCFYLYDAHIKALWPFIFRTWFVVSQVFLTLAFISIIAAEITLLTQSFNLLSPRGPRAVLFLFLVSGFSCLFILTGLITFGAAVDSEIRRRASVQQGWLQGLDESGLSWSFGLATVSLFGIFVTVIILGWCVYPKRVQHGLLLVNAWEWPTCDDLLCRKQMADLQVLSTRSRSDVVYNSHSGDMLSRSGRSDYIAHSALTGSGLSTQKSMDSLPYGMYPLSIDVRTHDGTQRSDQHSSYDPRSPDTISLLSVDPLNHSTASKERYSLISGHQSIRSHRTVTQTSTRSITIHDTESMTIEELSEPRRLLSQRSPEESIGSSATVSIQAARPMSKRRARRRSNRQPDPLYPPLTERLTSESSSDQHSPPVPTQTAKRMRSPN